jgi:hypothetical protein
MLVLLVHCEIMACFLRTVKSSFIFDSPTTETHVKATMIVTLLIKHD